MPPKGKTIDSPIWLLVRDNKDEKHHVIAIDQVQNLSKKKLKTNDSILFSITGARNDRMRGLIITMGDKAQCQHTLDAIDEHVHNLAKNVPVDVDNDLDNSDTDSEDTDLNPRRLIISSPHRQDMLDEASAAKGASGTIDESEPLEKNVPVNNITSVNEVVTVVEAGTNGTNTIGNNSSLRKSNKTGRSTKETERSGSVSINAYRNLQRRCTQLEKEIDLYQTTWMPRPKQSAVIDWIVECAKVLQGRALEEENLLDGEMGERLEEIICVLDMDEKELSLLHGSTITSTCRRIIAAKYPPHQRSSETYSSISNATYKAIRDYARFVHPSSAKTVSDGILNAAIGNVFAVYKSKNSKLLVVNDEDNGETPNS